MTHASRQSLLRPPAMHCYPLHGLDDGYPRAQQQHIPSNAHDSLVAAAPLPCCRDSWRCNPVNPVNPVKKPLNPWLRTAPFESLLAGTARQGRGRTEATESWRRTAAVREPGLRNRGFHCAARVPAGGDSPPGQGRTGATESWRCNALKPLSCVRERATARVPAGGDSPPGQGWRHNALITHYEYPITHPFSVDDRLPNFRPQL
jgi:hypothetical protein